MTKSVIYSVHVRTRKLRTSETPLIPRATRQLIFGFSSGRSITKAAFAATMGVDRSAATRWEKGGMPVRDDGMVNPVEAATWVRSNIQDYKLRGSLGAADMQQGVGRRLAMRAASIYLGGDEHAATVAAELLLPLLPEATVRTVVGDLFARLREASVACLSDQYAPPPDCRTWADFPRSQEVSPTESEWNEMTAKLSAGQAKQ